MRHQHVLPAVAFALLIALSGCGGQSASNFNPAPPAPVPLPAGQTTQSIAASGGSVSTVTPSGTLVATFPTGTFIAPTQVTLTFYSTQSQVPVTVQSGQRKKAQSLPTGFVFIGGFAIDTGTASMFEPVTMTMPLSATIPAGDVLRVAHYGPKGLTDVDTATATGSTVKNDVNKLYVSVSNGGVAAPYVVYAAPASAVAAPAAITISVAPAPSAPPLVIGTTVDYTATGSDANGNSLPFSPTFSTSGVGAQVSAGANPATGAVTASTQGGTLTITATDPRTTISGSSQATVFTQRPANAGDTFAFAGSLNQTDAYTYPQPNPLPATNVTAGVTQSVAVSTTPNPFGAGTAQDFNVSESDAYPSQTLSSKTDYFYQLTSPTAGSSQFQLLGYKSVDASSDTTSVQYTTPLIVDELPEVAGAAWTNTPAQTLSETTVNGDTIARTVNADGSYTENDSLYGNTNNYPSVAVAMTENPDGSGTFFITRHETNGPFAYPPGADALEDFYISGPVPSPYGLPSITYGFQSYISTSPPPAIAQYSAPAAPWYPLAGPTAIGPLYQENDTTASGTFPAACNVPSSFGTTGNELTQNVSSIDTILGTLTNTTTTQWVVTGFGPVCVQVASTIKAYYDYNNDTMTYGIVFQSAQPMQSTNIAETLTLQSTGTGVTAQGAGRARASYAPIAPGAIATTRIQIAQLIQRDRVSRLRSLALHLSKLAPGKGVR